MTYSTFINPDQKLEFMWDTLTNNWSNYLKAEYLYNSNNQVTREDNFLWNTSALNYDYTTSYKYYYESFNPVSTSFIEKENYFTLYPNPAFDKLYIKGILPDKQDILLMIVDMNGKQMYEEKRPSVKNVNFDISIANFASGIYFIQLTGNNFSTIQKFRK